MRMTPLILLSAVVGALSAVAIPSPRLIPFQGRLTDQNGVPYTEGQYTLTFTMYDQAVGGSHCGMRRMKKWVLLTG